MPATHRKIAAIAQVPLGSMTYYYFAGMDALLSEAFTQNMSRQYGIFAQVTADAEGVPEAITK